MQYPLECCPVCDALLPENPSDCLKMILEVQAWYENSGTSDSTRKAEHKGILCALHYIETHRWYKLGVEANWPMTLDTTWITSEVLKLREHCASVIVHAPAHEQFHTICELFMCGENDVLGQTPIDSYSWGRGWLRSAA
jgi:hypothetical protein